MLDATLDQFDPAIANALYVAFIALLGSLGWVGVAIKQILQTKQAQDSLRKALESGVDWVSDQIAEMLEGTYAAPTKDQIAGSLIDYVKGSVPDALKVLRKQATPEQLERMAHGKINLRLLELAPRELARPRDEQTTF